VIRRGVHWSDETVLLERVSAVSFSELVRDLEWLRA
jgi:hypothetical protein